MSIEKPINTLIRDYIEQMDAKPYVQQNTLWVLQRFVNWMVRNKIDVRNPRKADVIHYKNDIIAEGKTPTTVNRYLAPVRGFFRYLDDNHIFSNIAAGVRSPKDHRAFVRDYLNPDQVISLLELIPRSTIAGLRDFAMINVMVCLGLRRVEVLRLTVADLTNPDGLPVLNIHRKGREYKEKIRIETEVFEPIQTYLLARSNFADSEPLFANHSRHKTNRLSEVSISFIVKKYLKQINDSKKLTCHSLRHSAAINLLKAGRSIYDVQQMLGHISIKTTEFYLKAIEAEKRFNNPAARDLVQLYKKREENRQKQAISV